MHLGVLKGLINKFKGLIMTSKGLDLVHVKITFYDLKKSI